MLPIISGRPIKDWFILGGLLIIVFCILEILKLKKIIAKDIKRRLIPQLEMEFDSNVQSKDAGFSIRNESLFLAKDLQIKDIPITLNDFGFKKSIILKFEKIPFLKPRETLRLRFKVFDTNDELMPDVTERIIPHLVSPSFKIRIFFFNIENVKLCAEFSKIKNKIQTERIHPAQYINSAITSIQF